MSDYKCLLAGGPDSENSHDLLPKLMEPQTGLMSPFRHRPHFQGGWGWGMFGARHRTQRRILVARSSSKHPQQAPPAHWRAFEVGLRGACSPLSKQNAESESEAAEDTAPREPGPWRTLENAGQTCQCPFPSSCPTPPPPPGGSFTVTSCHRPPQQVVSDPSSLQALSASCQSICYVHNVHYLVYASPRPCARETVLTHI